MDVLISTVGYDSHYVLTNHAKSAACVMTTGIHEYCLTLSAVPSFNSFEHVSFSISCRNIHKYHYHGWEFIVTVAILWISLSPISQLTFMMTDCHNLTMSYCIVHRVITITITVPVLFHRSNHCGVMSVLLLHIRGSRTVSDTRLRPRGQSRCVSRSAFWLAGLPLLASDSAVQHAMKEWDA